MARNATACGKRLRSGSGAATIGGDDEPGRPDLRRQPGGDPPRRPDLRRPVGRRDRGHAAEPDRRPPGLLRVAPRVLHVRAHRARPLRLGAGARRAVPGAAAVAVDPDGAQRADRRRRAVAVRARTDRGRDADPGHGVLLPQLPHGEAPRRGDAAAGGRGGHRDGRLPHRLPALLGGAADRRAVRALQRRLPGEPARARGRRDRDRARQHGGARPHRRPDRLRDRDPPRAAHALGDRARAAFDLARAGLVDARRLRVRRVPRRARDRPGRRGPGRDRRGRRRDRRADPGRARRRARARARVRGGCAQAHRHGARGPAQPRAAARRARAGLPRPLAPARLLAPGRGDVRGRARPPRRAPGAGRKDGAHPLRPRRPARRGRDPRPRARRGGPRAGHRGRGRAPRARERTPRGGAARAPQQSSASPAPGWSRSPTRSAAGSSATCTTARSSTSSRSRSSSRCSGSSRRRARRSRPGSRTP